jgi:hypothetical protein
MALLRSSAGGENGWVWKFVPGRISGLFIVSPNLAHTRGSRYKCSSVCIQRHLIHYQCLSCKTSNVRKRSIVTSMRCTEKYKPLPTHGPHLPAEQRLRCEPVHGRCGWPLVVHVATLLHTPLWIE